MKKGKRLLILLAAVVLFGIGAWLLNQNTQKQEAAKNAAKQSAVTVLLTAPADSITTRFPTPMAGKPSPLSKRMAHGRIRPVKPSHSTPKSLRKCLATSSRWSPFVQ